MDGNTTSKNECKRYLALIEKRLDREITPEEDIDLETHLAICVSCREEMASYQAVSALIQEARENPVDVPNGLFESLETELEEVRPARGLMAILGSPFFALQRNRAYAMASVVLVIVLTVGVGRGIVDRFDQAGQTKFTTGPTKAVIMTNSGDAIILEGDEGDPDRYSAALDDLERAYKEAMGESDGGSEGYIHTSWSGGESASQIH